MGAITRTAIWTIAVIIICFLLAMGINRYRMQETASDDAHVQTGILTPANPGGNWPQFHGNQAQSGYVSGELPDQLVQQSVDAGGIADLLEKGHLGGGDSNCREPTHSSRSPSGHRGLLDRREKSGVVCSPGQRLDALLV